MKDLWNQTFPELEQSKGASFCFDNVLFISQAIQNLIDQGKDFDDFDNFNKSLRETSVIGSTGVVRISPKMNDRTATMYSIWNLRGTYDQGQLLNAKYHEVGNVCSFCAVQYETWIDIK